MVRALASHQCVPGSIPGPGVIRGLSLLLVLYSAPIRSGRPLARVIAQALPVSDVKFTFTFKLNQLSILLVEFNIKTPCLFYSSSVKLLYVEKTHMMLPAFWQKATNVIFVFVKIC